MKGYAVKDDTIVLNSDLTELDLFVKDFIEILNRHTDYLVVSGYVSICTGRSRATEDVDVIVPVMEKEVFHRLYLDLLKGQFWCYQGETEQETYEYIVNLNSIRFAKKGQMLPNIEFIPFDSILKKENFVKYLPIIEGELR